MLLGPNLPHTWLTHPGWRGKALATVIQFDPALFERPALPELAALQPLVHRSQRGLQVRPGSACHGLITQALTHVRNSAPLDQLAGLIHLLARLNEAPADALQPLSTASLAAPATSSPQPRRIDKVVDWLHAHLAEPLRAEDAARIAHISPAAFSRFFKRELGKTFTDYLNDARCSAAAMALRQTTQPVARIAQDCGFATASHFNVQFKRRYGVNARGYRQASG
ncbi:helix-turn-helix domain-containing protein [Ideonella paludis]|uniref:helix-turn-helix domain-containing protein n=1 Tax=Ideonella paludis TaxID=1233411 RepID=UPI00363F4863